MNGDDTKIELKTKAMRTSYYGKMDSEHYLHNANVHSSPEILMLNVLGDLVLLKEVFKSSVAINLMTIIVKIALNLCESKIASCIVAYYNAKLSENMVERALKTDQMDFIYTIWSYHKNYSSETKKDMTFQYLFESIMELCPETSKAKINQVVYWKIHTKENMLRALLENNADFSASKYTHLYFHDVDMELLLFCLKNTNQEFLKKALKDNVFTGIHLNNEKFIPEVIQIYRFGTRIDLLLNVLGYMEFTKWNQTQLKDFVSISQSISHEKFESNIIVLASNPVLSI